MKRMLFVILLISTIFFLSSCNQSTEKWLDYGNGMVNLSQTSRIDWGTQATYKNAVGDSITRSCQTVLDQYESAGWDKGKRENQNIECDSFIKFDLFTLTVGSKVITEINDITISEDEAKKNLEAIRAFIQAKENYLRL